MRYKSGTTIIVIDIMFDCFLVVDGRDGDRVTEVMDDSFGGRFLRTQYLPVEMSCENGMSVGDSQGTIFGELIAGN